MAARHLRQMLRHTSVSRVLGAVHQPPISTTTVTSVWARLYSQSKTPQTTVPSSFDKDALNKIVRTNKVVVFMKGNPDAPRCGFSNAVVQILRMHGVSYDAHDVMLSDDLRQAIKDFSEWPTIPQVYINGEFVGGCDILLQMHQSGDLIEELKKCGLVSNLLNRAKEEHSSEKEDDRK